MVVPEAEGILNAMWKSGAVALLVGSGALLWLKWKQDEPRRDCVQTLRTFCQILSSRNSVGLLDAVVLPEAVVSRTPPEQAEFIEKALQDEISPEGVDALKNRGTFGPLKQIFPAQADHWAAQAGVSPDNCLAFKMERGGVRAEVVIVTEGKHFRVLRCNNVRQMVEGG